VLDWNLYEKSGSLYNTPACFTIYTASKILQNYIDEFESVGAMEVASKEKAELIYDFLDSPSRKLFRATVSNRKVRSNVNVPFALETGTPDADVASYTALRAQFLCYCYRRNVVGLRTNTPFTYADLGMKEPLRISLYNGVSVSDVKELVQVMMGFEQEYMKQVASP
jgi:phosphoserine aminotransferase